MQRGRSWVAAAVVLLVGAGSGSAVAAPGRSPADGGGTRQLTCRGLPATIEGDVPQLVGTPGNDVIVAGGNVHHVLAGEGDDVICVLADDRKRLDVQAGPGADVVDTTASTTHTVVSMGTGTDTFIGGSHLDEVRLDQEPAGTTGVDVVQTGGGSDFLTAESAVDADLGPGDDFHIGEFTEGQGPSRIVLGQGHDTLRLDMGIAEHLRPASLATRKSLGTLRLDLGAGTLVQDGVRSTVAGAEEVIANGPRVAVQGTGGADQVVSGGCQVTMHGGGGRDHLTQVSGYDVQCGKRWAHLYGDGGPDQLQATSGNDVLIGGSGRDRVYGMGGRDRCVAEQKFTCER